MRRIRPIVPAPLRPRDPSRAQLHAQPRRLYPFEELAKYWEHRASPPDLSRALAISEEARERVAAGALRPRRGVRLGLAELDHRIARLRRRLGASGT